MSKALIESVWTKNTPEGVYSIALSNDAKLIASVTAKDLEFKVSIWDAENGTLVNTLKGVNMEVDEQGEIVNVDDNGGHMDYVNCVAFGHDGKQIVSGGQDNKIIVWNVADGTVVNTFDCESQVRSVAFNHNSTRIVSGDGSGKITVWNVTMQNKEGVVQASGPVISVAFNPSDTSIVATDKEAVILWNKNNDNLDSEWSDGVDNVDVFLINLELDDTVPDAFPLDKPVSAVFNYNGTKIAAAGDGCINIYDANKRTLMKQLGNQNDHVTSVALSNDFIFASYKLFAGKGSLKIWDADTGGLVTEFKSDKGTGPVVANRRALVYGGDKKISVWNIKNPVYTVLAALKRKDKLYGKDPKNYKSNSKELGKLIEGIPSGVRENMLSYLTGTKVKLDPKLTLKANPLIIPPRNKVQSTLDSWRKKGGTRKSKSKSKTKKRTKRRKTNKTKKNRK